jgi:hypothetical protein
MGRVPVIDPMEYQAERVIKFLDEESMIDRSDRLSTLSPVVLTTGTDLDAVRTSANELLGRHDAEVVQAQFGTGHTIGLVAPLRAASPKTTKSTKSVKSAKNAAERLMPHRHRPKQPPEQDDRPPEQQST